MLQYEFNYIGHTSTSQFLLIWGKFSHYKNQSFWKILEDYVPLL
jgi:hypothetical protein